VRLRGMSEPKGLSANYVSRWERDIVQPDPYHAYLLCVAFDMPPEQLGLGARFAHEEEATNRRQFTIVTAGALVATLTDGTVPWLNSEVWDVLLAGRGGSGASSDSFDYFLDIVDRCWGLLNSGNMHTAEHIMTSALPDMIVLAEHKSGARVAAAQGLRLLSVIRGHQLRLGERLSLSDQAVEYARRSRDQDAIASSLAELAVSYKYAGQFENSFTTYLAALPYAQAARPLVRSRIYGASAAAFAQKGAMPQSERYTCLAKETVPSRPDTEHRYLSADCGFHLLAFYEGIAHMSFGRPGAALRAFQNFMQGPLAASTPQRNRLEIVNQQGRAAIMARDLEQYAAHLEAATTGALAIDSRKRFDEALSLCRDLAPPEWHRDSRIRAIIEPFDLLAGR
jgi:transcriptional regulator with XRE-family HTH domain